jgi:hypothetical protein
VLHEVFLAAIDFFAHHNVQRFNTVWEREDFMVSAFGRLSDALQPIRELVANGSLDGWGRDVELALGETVERFDAIVKAWGWRRVADPEPRRSAYVTKSRKRFRKDVEQPLAEAALAITEGCRTLRQSRSLDSNVTRWAEEGRRRGISSTMTAEEGKDRFAELQAKCASTPMLGTRDLGIDADVRAAMDLAIRTLNRALVTARPAPNTGPVEKLSRKRLEELLKGYGDPGQRAIHLMHERGEIDHAPTDERKLDNPVPPSQPAVTGEGQGRQSVEGTPIVLRGPDDDVVVCGKRKDPLPPAQYRVIKALVDAKANEERLTVEALRNRTTDEKGNPVEDPLGALKRLRNRDRDWKRIIDMAGVRGRGYGLKDCPPTYTQKN